MLPQDLQYRPYSALQFSLEHNNLKAVTPWLEISVEVDEDNLDFVKKIVHENAAARDTDKANEFFSFFKELPFLYVKPRKNNKSNEHIGSFPDNKVLNSNNPRDFVSFIADRLDINAELAFDCIPEEFSWELDKVLEFSRVEGIADLYDPYSAYTYIRELRLIHQASKTEETLQFMNFLRSLQQKNESQFFNFMAQVMCQQFYVTKECCNCLYPALDAFPAIRPAVEKYISEEQNHDKLILKSIRHLTDKSESEFYFTPEIMIETDIVKYAAHVCPLSFSCLVSIMEGSSYPDTDPVGALLSASSKPEAAKGVEAHFQINKQGNHTAIPESFIKLMPAVDRNTVISAMRMTEIAILLDANIVNSMYSKFLENN